MQHGPLITFHLNLTQGNALVRYSSKEEAAKAQKSLHMCVLGNTTILAEFAGEEEVQRFFAQGQQLASTTSWQADPGVNQTRMGGSGPRSSHPIGHPHWNSGGSSGGMGGGGAKTGGDLLWGGVPQYSSLWGPPSGEEGRVMGSPTPINTLLPGDLLSGESMIMIYAQVWVGGGGGLWMGTRHIYAGVLGSTVFIWLGRPTPPPQDPNIWLL
ncbi:unnamed protein product, partial [Oncorhynchus mykiss]